MYRLLLYFLILLLIIAIIFSFFGLLPFSPLAIFFSSALLLLLCYITNTIFSKVLKIPTNGESFYITAYILALIITPAISIQSITFLIEASILAMASKYILVFQRKHFFNPAAIAVVITSFIFGQAASWWIGTAIMAPFVVLGGLLIVRKIQKEYMVVTFFAVALFISLFLSFFQGANLFLMLQRILLDSSLFFMGFIMLTEPHTTPPTRKLQMFYGGLVGLFFSPQIHFGVFYATPEIALVIGNVFSYIVSPKQKLLLILKEKIQTSKDTMDFLFARPRDFVYKSGQYMEWTLSHKNSDTRGNRRYFTLSSSPTEETLRIGVKFYDKGSSFKKTLRQLTPKTPLLAGLLTGDFTLPKDTARKLTFLAGGIGITPFRSMLQYLLDRNEKRDIIILYANKIQEDIVYKDVLDSVGKVLGIKVVYTLTDEKENNHWKGLRGKVDEKMIQDTIPDYKERFFYLSGPKTMVDAYENVLHALHIPSSHIKVDFFPGYA